MKKIVIFGAGKAGQFLYDQIVSESEDYMVIAFIDNIVKESYNDVPVMEPQYFFESANIQYDAIFLAAGAQKTLKLMIKTCRKYNVADIYMMHDIAGKCQLSLFENGKMITRYIRKLRFSKEKPSLSYFEVPITDNCNLNCKGCLFASNVTSGVKHVPLEELKRDAKRMSELFYDVPWIRILGGEPLMHPDIKKILTYYRECFQDSEIDLCTNGLLIPKMDADFWTCIKDNRISIHVSGYKPTYSMLDKIDCILKEQKVPYAILKREEFAKYYTKHGNNDIHKSYEKCMASGCYEVYRGKISTCSAMIAFERFNEQFGTSYEVIENEDWFDIHNPNLDAWEVCRKLDMPSQMCKYCSDSVIEKFEWDYSGKSPNLDDFIVRQ